MFIDIVTVKIAAGNGGDGKVNFRHEKYVEKGGPDGGDGGNGGNVIMQATRNENTLAVFRYTKELKAENGQSGGMRNKHGRSAQDLVIPVPVGTVVKDLLNNEVIADFTEDGAQAIIAKGGDGGFGNAHFTSSVRQAPRVAEKGEKGEIKEVQLEMKLVADIGLVGLPNAGKSSFLSVVSNARPEIADYPFTTLTPNLGVADISGISLLIADVPGLIEGASKGKGLGDTFLRHISRCQILLHLIDATSNDVVADYNAIRGELVASKELLAQKDAIVVLTKIDLLDDDLLQMQKEALSKVVPQAHPIMEISAQAHKGTKELLKYAANVIVRQADEMAKTENNEELPVIRLNNNVLPWRVSIIKKGRYLVTGHRIEKFARRTDYENVHGVNRLKDIMQKMGITHELIKQDIQPGDTIVIGEQNYGQITY
ncbi:GTPase ObgE [Candidatus Saccharibacteria bacterium]|nr:GTPase ObgE [Candidatus Saccharibacteria bacterium]